MEANLFTPRLLMLLAAGGVLGTLARYGTQLLLQPHPGAFPWGTLAVNLTGSLIFGFVARYLAGGGHDTVQLRVALTVGFCGAFTTMSSFSYETLYLLETARYLSAGLYFTASLVGSIGGLAGGLLLGAAMR